MYIENIIMELKRKRRKNRTWCEKKTHHQWYYWCRRSLSPNLKCYIFFSCNHSEICFIGCTFLLLALLNKFRNERKNNNKIHLSINAIHTANQFSQLNYFLMDDDTQMIPMKNDLVISAYPRSFMCFAQCLFYLKMCKKETTNQFS